MTNLNALIERLEKAPEGSRELDALIECFKRGVIFERQTSTAVFACMPGGDSFHIYWDEIPRFSSSMDEAIQLVPPHWGWQISDRAPDPHKGRAYLHNRELHFAGMAAAPNPKLRISEATAYTPVTCPLHRRPLRQHSYC